MLIWSNFLVFKLRPTQFGGLVALPKRFLNMLKSGPKFTNFVQKWTKVQILTLVCNLVALTQPLIIQFRYENFGYFLITPPQIDFLIPPRLPLILNAIIVSLLFFSLTLSALLSNLSFSLAPRWTKFHSVHLGITTTHKTIVKLIPKACSKSDHRIFWQNQNKSNTHLRITPISEKTATNYSIYASVRTNSH